MTPDPHLDAALERLAAARRNSNRARGLAWAYRWPVLRRGVLRLVLRLEGGDMHSQTLRELLRRYHEVEAGLYSYGPPLCPGGLPPGARVGRYCSFAGQIEVFRRNHPLERVSLHPFFYNGACGLTGADTIPSNRDNPLCIGHDVWIGLRAIILPRCGRIGDGAVIGAGAVVTRDVPPFAIVAGNPGRVIGERFTPELRQRIVESRWWDQPVERLAEHLPRFVVPASLDGVESLRAGWEGRPGS